MNCDQLGWVCKRGVLCVTAAAHMARAAPSMATATASMTTEGASMKPQSSRSIKNCVSVQEVARAAHGPVEESQAIDVPDPGSASTDLGRFW